MCSVPDIPVTELKGGHVGHTAPVNGLIWSPHTKNHICTVADDKQVLIWDVDGRSRPVNDPLLQYIAPSEVNNVEWSKAQRQWMAICVGDCVQILKI